MKVKQLPSEEVKKEIEQIKIKKREPILADEALKKKANEILCCVYISWQTANKTETSMRQILSKR